MVRYLPLAKKGGVRFRVRLCCSGRVSCPFIASLCFSLVQLVALVLISIRVRANTLRNIKHRSNVHHTLARWINGVFTNNFSRDAHMYMNASTKGISARGSIVVSKWTIEITGPHLHTAGILGAQRRNALKTGEGLRCPN